MSCGVSDNRPMRRALLFLVWLLAAGGLAVLVLTVYELKRTPPIQTKPIAVDRQPPRQRYNALARWTLTEHLSAHNVLIGQVETEFLDEAMFIAQQLTEPLKDKYAEVLIYFHRPGRPDTLAPRRVQWTPKNGYVETRYD
jgi:hypothetical protein